MHEKKLQVGFTLAEVLITLGIIGIVAAMTMPMLLAKYQNMVLLTRVKKTYSTITNAINLAKADIGDTTNITSIFNLSNTSVQTLETMKKYFTGAVLCESVNTCPNYPVKAQYGQSNVITGAMEYRDRFSPPYLKLADGSFLKISQYSSCSTMRTATKCITDSSGNPVANSDGSDCEREEYEWLDRRCANIIIDTNGTQGPNQYGADVYQIGVYENGQLKEVAGYGNLNTILSSDEIEYIQYSVQEN